MTATGREVARYAILGNSGSGKSTLAKALVAHCEASYLDLDSVAWVPGSVGVPREPGEAERDVCEFCACHPQFVLEGCYENLMAAALPFQPLLVFLDADAGVCEAHCRARPWEPHKYATADAQNEKLQFLLEWVRGYYTRTGPLSHAAHAALYDAWSGPKVRFHGEVTVGAEGDILPLR